MPILAPQRPEQSGPTPTSLEGAVWTACSGDSSPLTLMRTVDTLLSGLFLSSLSSADAEGVPGHTPVPCELRHCLCSYGPHSFCLYKHCLYSHASVCMWFYLSNNTALSISSSVLPRLRIASPSSLRSSSPAHKNFHIPSYLYMVHRYGLYSYGLDGYCHYPSRQHRLN